MVGSLGWRYINFHNSFFLLKTIYYLNLNFFRVLQSTLLKSEKKSQKKCKPPKEIALHSKRYKQIFKKERGKRKMRKHQTTTVNIFLLLLF